MAADMRAAIQGLPWVTRIGLTLDEHMYADEINRGMANGLSFQQAFGDAANDDLEAVRKTFLMKAFQRRQEALLSHLLEKGHEAAALLALALNDLAALATDNESTHLIERYIERRHVVSANSTHAFVDTNGALIDPSAINAYLRASRRVGVNAEFNSALCRGLLAARYDIVEEKTITFYPKTGAHDAQHHAA
jgi:hypothetical protein